MFAIRKEINKKSEFLETYNNQQDAENKLKALVTQIAKQGPNTTDEGTFYELKDDRCHVTKNTVTVSAGVVWNGTEVKTEQVAIYDILEFVKPIEPEAKPKELFNNLENHVTKLSKEQMEMMTKLSEMTKNMVIQTVKEQTTKLAEMTKTLIKEPIKNSSGNDKQIATITWNRSINKATLNITSDLINIMKKPGCAVDFGVKASDGLSFDGTTATCTYDRVMGSNKLDISIVVQNQPQHPPTIIDGHYTLEQLKSLPEGTILDARDGEGRWYPSKIINKYDPKNDTIGVHFTNWRAGYNECNKVNTDRFAKLNTYTVSAYTDEPKYEN